MAIDPTTTIPIIKLTLDLLKNLSEKLKKPRPDVTEALNLIPQLQEKIFDLQQLVYQLQSENLGLKAENNQLRSQPNQEELWQKTKSQYELKEVYENTRLYIPKDGSKRQICPICLEKDRKPITLQRAGNPSYLMCPVCNGYYQVKYVPPPPEPEGPFY